MKVSLKQRREKLWRDNVRDRAAPLVRLFNPDAYLGALTYAELLTTCRDSIDAELDEVSTGEGTAP